MREVTLHHLHTLSDLGAGILGFGEIVVCTISIFALVGVVGEFHAQFRRCVGLHNAVSTFVESVALVGVPHGGVRRFRWTRIPGCYVAKCAPHKALKLIARGKLTFGERAVLNRVDGSVIRNSSPN